MFILKLLLTLIHVKHVLGTDELIKLLLPVFSMFSPHASRRKTDPSVSQTSSAIPSNHSSSVTEMASEAPQTPSSAHSQAQTPGPQNEAHAAEPENRAVISDSLAQEQDPPKGIEEIRKAAEAAVEELEKLEQMKETTKKNLERLKLAEELAMKQLARSQKQSEEVLGVQQARKVYDLLS
jgi:predicted lipid-binding transport protein (Tim44 family)